MKFKEFSEKIYSVLGSAKEALKSLEEEADKAEKRVADAEIKLRYSVMSHDDQVVKNSSYMKEFNEKKENLIKELESARKETAQAHDQAISDRDQAEKLLKEAERKNEQATSRLEEAEKIKSELASKKQRAAELAQAI